MNKNEKYFLNSSHAALSSFQSSGRITRDIREMAQLAISPNFSSTSRQRRTDVPEKLRISLTLCKMSLAPARSCFAQWAAVPASWLVSLASAHATSHNCWLCSALLHFSCIKADAFIQ